MTTHGRVRVLAIASCGLALAAAALGTAGPANADIYSFERMVADAGIHTERGELDILEAGFEVCALIKEGLSPDKVMQQALYNSSREPFYGLTEDQAHTMYRLSVQELCTAYDGSTTYIGRPLP